MNTRTAEYESFSHEVLWRAARYSARLASNPESQVRPDHLTLQALLMGFLAFEGFLNFLGEQIDPDTWHDERNFFSGGKYRGVEGKLLFLFEKIPGITLTKGSEPYQTFKRLKTLRDLLAHSKTHRYSLTHDMADEDATIPAPNTSWQELVDASPLEKSLSRLQELAEMMREPASKIVDEYERDHLWYKAFQGPISSSEGITFESG